jgi:hypothetical protein
MASPAIRIYDALKPALGEETTKEFIEALDESFAAKIEIMKGDLATKGDVDALREARGDIASVKDEIAALRLETKSDIAAVKDEIAALRLETKSDITGVKDEIAALRLETKSDIAALRLETKSEIGALKSDMQQFKLEMRDDFHSLRAETIKTACIMTLVQLIAIIGAVLTIIKAAK